MTRAAAMMVLAMMSAAACAPVDELMSSVPMHSDTPEVCVEIHVAPDAGADLPHCATDDDCPAPDSDSCVVARCDPEGGATVRGLPPGCYVERAPFQSECTYYASTSKACHGVCGEDGECGMATPVVCGGY